MRHFINLVEAALTGKVPATPENIALAREFVFQKWKERAAENGREEPKDLSLSCKFTSQFSQRLFGGTIRGSYDHQFVVLPNDQILDLNIDAEDVRRLEDPHRHDPAFFGTRDHRISMKSCRPRVDAWVKEFVAKVNPAS